MLQLELSNFGSLKAYFRRNPVQHELATSCRRKLNVVCVLACTYIQQKHLMCLFYFHQAALIAVSRFYCTYIQNIVRRSFLFYEFIVRGGI